MIKNKIFGHLKRLKYRIISPERYRLTKAVCGFLSGKDCHLPENEKNIIKKHLSWNIIHLINYPFVNEYLFRKINVLYDSRLNLPYVMHNNKKLYFRRGTKRAEIESAYNTLCIEQDKRSPHSYWQFDIPFTDSDIAIDAGAAEGIWGLDIVEKVKALYLFETEEEWIEALNATFSPWKDKVHIIKKFVSDTTDENNIRLDDIFTEKGIYPTILKADVEGCEISLAKGSETLLSKHLRHVILCTYHSENDYADLANILDKYNFKYCYSTGYMFTIYNPKGNYFSGDVSKIIRKGLIYGKK